MHPLHVMPFWYTMSNLEFHSLLAEGDLLADQVNSVKHAAELVSQLRRVGKGLGVYQFDKDLQ